MREKKRDRKKRKNEEIERMRKKERYRQREQAVVLFLSILTIPIDSQKGLFFVTFIFYSLKCTRQRECICAFMCRLHMCVCMHVGMHRDPLTRLQIPLPMARWVAFSESVPLPPGSQNRNIPKRSPPRGEGFPAVRMVARTLLTQDRGSCDTLWDSWLRAEAEKLNARTRKDWFLGFSSLLFCWYLSKIVS